MVIVIALPVAVGLVVVALPVPHTSTAQLWPLGADVAIATFMCMRGRVVPAWIGMGAAITVATLWFVETGRGLSVGLANTAVNFAPMVMATFFAFVIRRLARSIDELQTESTRRVASQAAAEAALDERRVQARALDDRVRPTLEHLSQVGELDPSTVLQSRLLEAELRDTLRAPGLAHEPIIGAARAARTRGVMVLMIDDGGLDSAATEARSVLFGAVRDELERALGGTVTVRVLPPGRRLLATIVVADEILGNRRTEIGSTTLKYARSRN